ncbi:YopX family protein [Mammaliicoccus sciuri]|uniref:YopX family protein n=1 Tax=Mammaliicoccus sciuri TaxID=1296 RepID=UPI0008784F18|nr:YopX family protein [Mammaliicoccus sciuri]
MIPKFRAWDKVDKKMIEDVASIYFKAEMIVTRNLCFYPFKDIELMQSTGLKDINGTEIFEGDITKVHEFVDFGGVEGEKEIIGVIKYGRVYECPIKEWYLKTKFYYTPLACMNLHEESFEILGNKFEHPHLLEEG